MLTATSKVTDLSKNIKKRYVSSAQNIEVLTDIYQETCHMAVWQRRIDHDFSKAINALVSSDQEIRIKAHLTPQTAQAYIKSQLADFDCAALLSEDIAYLVDVYCCLFELKEVGLRFNTLEHAMCPRFHVDKIPCRLITTYQGKGSEWLPHDKVDRSQLSAHNRLNDEGYLFDNADDIQHLNAGEVALLKGEYWQGNENAGLVHRSPFLQAGEKRLILTLDIV